MNDAPLFSVRNSAAPAVVATDYVPYPLKVQACRILMAVIGRWVRPERFVANMEYRYPANAVWAEVSRFVAYERGLPLLVEDHDDPMGDCLTVIGDGEFTLAMDVLECCLRQADTTVRKWDEYQRQYANASLSPDEAIREFNSKCRQAGFGYQYADGRLIPSTSDHIHEHAVRPALTLLQDEGFRGAQQEFMEGFAKLRRGDHKGAIVEACKAFESTMKTVCERKRWQYEKTSTARQLINVLVTNGLVPTSLQTQFAHFRELLESGIPTVRNKNGGHGDGAEPVEVSRELAEYALNLTAVNLVFLMELARTK